MSNVNSGNSSSGEDDEKLSSVRQNKYTQEQKIVSAVWAHERRFNGQTFEDIRSNFFIRFNMQSPEPRTITRWESRLFQEGSISFSKGNNHRQRPMKRLMHVPYVRASFREKPNLTLIERASQLGLTKHVLRAIIKYDLKESDIKHLNKDNLVDGDDKNTQDQDDINSS